MFSKFFAIAAVFLTFSAQVHAHAAIAPVLGVTGAPKRADVQRPSTASACGKTNVAATIDKSTPVVAAADGSFTVTATNFNGGKDGSRQVTMTVDATGAGKNFVAGTVSKNGVLAPATTGSDQITAALPAGTKCTGGATGNLCLASFKTAGGFGNCVVVQQGAAAAAGGAAGAATPNAAAANNGTAAANNGTVTATNGTAAGTTATTATGTGKGRKNIKDRVKAAVTKAAGTRAPRARLAQLEDDHSTLENVKRSVIGWIWA